MTDINDELEILSKETTLSLNPNKNNLSDDQSAALIKLNEWVYSNPKSRDDNNFFRLTGSAGTGKTTLLATFLKDIKYPFNKGRICVCAPTHKAKKIVAEKTNWKNTETLQALLGLKMDVDLENFDINNPQFNPIGDRKIRDYDLVVVDEASMINEDLYITLTDCAKSSSTKVLFVGDTKQLNPVKEYTISLALISPVHGYDLTQIVRQNVGNPLILLLDCLRYDIEHNTYTYLDLIKKTPINFNDKGEGYAIKEAGEFAKDVSKEFLSEDFKNNQNHCRYISWTNDSISKTNMWIRSNVFSVKDFTCQEGEILLSYKTVMDDDEAILTNADDYVITKSQDYLVSDWDFPLKVKLVELEGLDTGRVANVKLLTREEENYKNYVSIFNNQLERAKRIGKKGWGKFYEFKNSILVLENLIQNKQLVVKKDIDYGYGITIHKSQGSTYNTVFVNGKDINKNINDLERKRLWYVALSRASNKVYINL